MGVKESVKALEQTESALAEIGKQIIPFVNQLSDDDPAKKAQAQGVMALALGTLRYMGARLQGLDQGRLPDDPLRQELNQMRKVLSELEKKRKANEDEQQTTKNKQDSSAGKQDAPTDPPAENSKGKIIDKKASGRMVKAAITNSNSPQKRTMKDDDPRRVEGSQESGKKKQKPKKRRKS